MHKKHLPFLLLLFVYTVLGVITLIFYNGTGGSGDTILHYLFALWAPKHPELYLDHWAKPVFTLLASPFAQFGLVGIKTFNLLTTLATLTFVYLSALRLQLKHAAVSVIILICCPLYYTLTFSGLTEPLFAAFCAAGMYFTLSNRWTLAAIILSFLPFVRSEGWIILGVFAFYFLIHKQWKVLPYLLLGHLIMALAGLPIYGDILWIFNRNPYAKLDSTYGEGTLFHFADQLTYVIGIPVYILFSLGIVRLVTRIVKKEDHTRFLLLPAFGFFSFFIAHSLFWYLGIFNSMGLKRVLISVLPFLAIHALDGLEMVKNLLTKWKPIAGAIGFYLLLGLVVIFPFLKNHASIQWETMRVSKSQNITRNMCKNLTEEMRENHCLFYADPYIALTLNHDYFDNSRHQLPTPDGLQTAKPGDVVVWENWFSVVEYGLTFNALANDPSYKFIGEQKGQEKGREIHYAIFVKQ